MKAVISFNIEWIFSDGGVHSSAPTAVRSAIKDKLSPMLKSVDAGFTELTAEFDNSVSDEELRKKLLSVIEDVIGCPVTDNVCSVTVESADSKSEDSLVAAIRSILFGGSAEEHSGDGGSEPEESETKPAAEPRPTPDKAEPERSRAKELLSECIGFEDFKAYCEEIYLLAPHVAAKHTESVFRSTVLVFQMDSGNGYTHALNILSEVLRETGILQQGNVTETELPAFSMNEKDDNSRALNVINSLPGRLNSPGILSIDVGGWLGHTSHPIFKSLLNMLFRARGNCVVVFRIPSVGKSAAEGLLEDMNDIITARSLTFAPYTPDELREFAVRRLKGIGYEISDSGLEVYDRLILDEKRDGFFYGVNTVHKVVDRMVGAAQLYCATKGESLSVISGEMIESLCSDEVDITEDPLNELLNMIGMEGIYAQLQAIISQIIMARTSGIGSPCMHMTFVGPPGTGKTTVARILGQSLHYRGVLRVGKFYEHKGRDLCGRYVGETAPLTTSICREAYGSLLFLDEAYALYRGEYSSERDYGPEALTTLVAEMENHSDDLVVIFAGYEKPIDVMLTGNAGLPSRVPYRLVFHSYSRDELCRIFMLMTKKKFAVAADFEPAAKRFFDGLPDELVNSDTFGNARFARNVYERVWSKAIARCPGVTLDKLVLTAEDVEAAAAEFAVSKKSTAPGKTPIGF